VFGIDGMVRTVNRALHITDHGVDPRELFFSGLVKNPPIFPLTHDVRDFFELKSVMTSSFKRFAPVSRAFYSPEAVCGRFSGSTRGDGIAPATSATPPDVRFSASGG